MDQLIISLTIFFFILITCLLDVVLILEEESKDYFNQLSRLFFACKASFLIQKKISVKGTAYWPVVPTFKLIVVQSSKLMSSTCWIFNLGFIMEQATHIDTLQNDWWLSQTINNKLDKPELVSFIFVVFGLERISTNDNSWDKLVHALETLTFCYRNSSARRESTSSWWS